MRNNRTIIIGSGVAAVAVARRILSRNPSAEVHLLEAGGDLPMADYRKWLDFVMTGISPTNTFIDGERDADINADGGFHIRGGRLIVRGGSTNHWVGWCPRMKPEDFRLGDVRPNEMNWPISYDGLAPYYTQAEAFLSVCGDSSSTNPPRFGDRYPFDAAPFTALDRLVMPTLDSLGYEYEALPIARDPNRCRTTGTCDYCPFDAKYAAGSDLDALLREFRGRVSLRINSPALSIRMKDKKTAEGVDYLEAKSGEKSFLAGNRVVVAAGTIESTKLLLASHGSFWPHGIGNDTGHLGRHLTTHYALRGVARIPNNRNRIEQEIDFPTLICRHFDSEEYQPEGKMLFSREGRYIVPDIADSLIRGKSPDAIDEDIVSNTKIELFGMMEAFAAEGNMLSLAGGSTASGLPRTKVRYFESAEIKKARLTNLKRLHSILRKAGFQEPPDTSWEAPDIVWPGARADHATGTCRMASSATDGVVDPALKAHDTDNLFVCANGVFPNSGAANPTLTLVALALRLGDALESA